MELVGRIHSNDKKRQLYVAMTRAKQNLFIHLNGNYLDDIYIEGIERKLDNSSYAPDNQLIIHLTHKDIWLSYCADKQYFITKLMSGDKLGVNNEGCFDNQGNCVLKYSTSFKEKIVEYEQKGYKLTTAKINYIVYWRKEDTESDVRIILPELKLEKQ